MRNFVLSVLLVLTWGQTMSAQTATFDIATFVPPPGWKHTETPGLLTIQDQRTVQGHKQFCQIFLFASQAGSPNPGANFQLEWDRKVAEPLHFSGRPSVQSETNAEGWTTLTDHADALSQGVPIRVILFTATKLSRFVTVVVSVSPNSYQPELVNFFQSLNFHDPGSGPVNPSSPGANPGPANPGAPADHPVSGSLANYVFTAPPGWARQDFPDRIALVSPVFSNGEACQITMLPFQQSSGDVSEVALGAFRNLFHADPLSTYPVPPGQLARGFSPGGWEYFSLKKLVGGQEGEARTSGAIVLVVKVDGQTGIIIGTSKDFMVSNCFGLLQRDLWPNFFYSLQFKNAKSSGREVAAIKQRLAGSWITATGSAGLHYTFQANGRYADTMATQYRTRNSNTEELQTTTGFFGNGSYSFDNHTLILQRDDHTRFVYLFRLEQVSKDSGNSWADELVMLEPGASGEVRYQRTQ